MNKKYIFTILIMIASLFSANAQYGGTFYRKGFELGAALGLNNSNGNIYSLTMINGLMVSPIVFIGTGVGIGLYTNSGHSNEKYTQKSEEVMPVPVFGTIRVNLGQNDGKAIKPYVRLDGGYTFNISSNSGTKFGFMIEPQVGVEYRINNLSFYAAAGFNVQNHEYQRVRIDGTSYDDSEYLKAISIKAGLMF